MQNKTNQQPPPNMSKKESLTHEFRIVTKDGRKGSFRLSFKNSRVQLDASIEGSNKLKKIGESATIGVTLPPGNEDVFETLFNIITT